MGKLRLAALALSFAVLCGTAHAQDNVDSIDNKEGKLGRLSPNIGTYRYDAILNDPWVAADLLRRLGPKGVDSLKARLAVEHPIEFDGASIVLRGSMPHSGSIDEAILSVRPRDGHIEAAMLIDGRQVSASIDQFMPQFPDGAVQSEAARWAQKAKTQVHLIKAGG